MTEPAPSDRDGEPKLSAGASDGRVQIENVLLLAERSTWVIEQAVEAVARARATRQAIIESRNARASVSRPVNQPATAPVVWVTPAVSGRDVSAPCPTAELSPRLRETLDHLLQGDSEKQVAQKMGISRHTVHLYSTALYRHFDVHSRAELLARCLAAAPRATPPSA